MDIKTVPVEQLIKELGTRVSGGVLAIAVDSEFGGCTFIMRAFGENAESNQRLHGMLDWYISDLYTQEEEEDEYI